MAGQTVPFRTSFQTLTPYVVRCIGVDVVAEELALEVVLADARGSPTGLRWSVVQPVAPPRSYAAIRVTPTSPRGVNVVSRYGVVYAL